jgi:hypothetical protein
MNCEFCGNKCWFSRKENVDKDNKKKYISVYDCMKCPVHTSFYINNEDGSKVKTVFMLDRNEKVYMWTDHFVKNFSYVTDIGISLARDGRDPLIIKFPKLMNVKPTNVLDKFKFYMVFL